MKLSIVGIFSINTLSLLLSKRLSTALPPLPSPFSGLSLSLFLSAPLRAFLAFHPSFLLALLIYWYAIVKALPGLTD